MRTTEPRMSNRETWLRRMGLVSILMLSLVSPVCFGLSPAQANDDGESSAREASAITNVNAALAMASAKLGTDKPTDGLITCSVVRAELTGSSVYAFFFGQRPAALSALDGSRLAARTTRDSFDSRCQTDLERLASIVLHC